MLFTAKSHEAIRRGEITLTVRRWLRPQAKVGGRYRLHTGGAIEATEVREVDFPLRGRIEPLTVGPTSSGVQGCGN